MFMDGEWLFWQYCDRSDLPGDMYFWYNWGRGVCYFYCQACMREKFERWGWTPGLYINEDGAVSSDSEDEYFLSRMLLIN